MKEIKLTPEEDLELRTFMTRHAKEVGYIDGHKNDGRKEMFRNHAIEELLRLREENERRALSQKEPVAKSDRELLFCDGVVKTRWRDKEDRKSSLEKSKADMSAALETLKDGIGR